MNNKKSTSVKAPSQGIRVVLMDDNELFRTGIESLLSAEGTITVVGAARERDRALDLIRNKRPHVILLNLELKQGEGLEMIPALLSACKTSRLAVLTDSRDPEIHREIISSGAIGVISKQESPELLKKAIKRVHSGSTWLDRFTSAEIIGAMSGRQHNGRHGYKIGSLTKREREVIRFVGKGLKNKEIADRLCISDVTVHHHLTSIYSKLEVGNRLELIIFAYKHNLAEVPC
jgi:two-component system nitrate/nitrite response regulator NarL